MLFISEAEQRSSMSLCSTFVSYAAVDPECNSQCDALKPRFAVKVTNQNNMGRLELISAEYIFTITTTNAITLSMRSYVSFSDNSKTVSKLSESFFGNY